MAVSFNRVSIWLRPIGNAARIRSSLPRSPRTRRAAAAGPAPAMRWATIGARQDDPDSKPAKPSKCAGSMRRRLFLFIAGNPAARAVAGGIPEAKRFAFGGGSSGNLANTASRTRRVAHMRAWLTLIAHSTLRSPLRSLFRACKALRHLRSPQTSCARHSSFYRHMSRMAVSANSVRCRDAGLGACTGSARMMSWRMVFLNCPIYDCWDSGSASGSVNPRPLTPQPVARLAQFIRGLRRR
jgi:hypothetical protein